MENQHEDKSKTSHFFILIPSEVLTMTELSEGAKLLYGEILFLSQKNNYCFATNDYFMKLNSVSRRTIVSRLTELKNAGLIKTEVVRNSQTRQVEKRNIYITKDFSKIDQKITAEENRNLADGKDDKKLTFGEYQNVFLTEKELADLHQKFTEQLFNAELPAYSQWKKINNANPKSDYETIEKWLKNKNGTYKKNMTAVKETGVDEVSQETLENLPF